MGRFFDIGEIFWHMRYFLGSVYYEDDSTTRIILLDQEWSRMIKNDQEWSRMIKNDQVRSWMIK